MSNSRRNFIKLAALAGASLTVGTNANASTAATIYPDTYGVLHDATLCIGCRSCEEACNKENNLPAPEKPFHDKSVFEKIRRGEQDTYTVVNEFKSSDSKEPIFVKQQCNHCLDPSCASACFTNALINTPEGAVVYDASVCVGCRYCMIACPWSVPAYEYHDPFTPKVVKCTMCYSRIKEGKQSSCVDACPTGALLFDKRKYLIKEARDRIRRNPDKYVDHIYGEKEAGGTNWLYLSSVDFNKIGLSTAISHIAPPEKTRAALSFVPMILGLWPVFLGGLWAMNKYKESYKDIELKRAVKKAVKNGKLETEVALDIAEKLALKEKEKAILKAVKKAVSDTEKKLKKENV